MLLGASAALEPMTINVTISIVAKIITPAFFILHLLRKVDCSLQNPLPGSTYERSAMAGTYTYNET
jgi:hypothetical protein